MTTDPALLQPAETESRDTDPNVRQRRASNPAGSVWVNASAGTGKTKVLTDRVLRLLLPSEDGQPGTKPHRILCLTFTKAAAAEMALRINARLSEWAVMSDEELKKTLKEDLLGKTPTPQMMEAARRLFVEVLDSPGGLNIMTIHAFCQSLLGRFPIEADLPPNFRLVEEGQAAILLDDARHNVLHRAEELDLKEQLELIAGDVGESQFTELLTRHVCPEVTQLERILKEFKDAPSLYASLCRTLNAPHNMSEIDVLTEFCSKTPATLTPLCRALSQGGMNNRKMAAALQSWIEGTPETRKDLFDDYAAALMTTKQEPRAIDKKLLQAEPELANMLATEVHRILETVDTLCALRNVKMSRALLTLGQAILKEYRKKKEQLGVLDYEDLISRTLGLLSGQTDRKIDPSWVLYKLDGGLDHILIDEAQDTNPEQWKIISILAHEFFSGEGQSDITRTLFVVGDEKQSIYSFQRAAPKEFERMRSYFAAKINESGNRFNKEDMITSFRSTKTVLRLVDEVFAADAAKRGLGDNILPHEAFRREDAGYAEIWPLTAAQEPDPEEPWTPPVTVQDVTSAPSLLSAKIADTIDGWLKTGEKLESQDRPIKAGDILILVRTRTSFVSQLVKALKSKNIPVSGVDRLVLTEALAVQDLIVAAEFALLPFHNLALATLLKSPLIGLNDDQLYTLAIDRPGSLWEAVQDKADKQVVEYCRGLIGRAKYMPPYDFFAHILQTPCPASPESGLKAVLTRLGSDSLDPLEEMMGLALNSEGDAMSSLQSFVHAFRRNKSDIKRELEEAGNAVRIMTIHGAKGLQAPIVFLPDTTRTHNSRRTPRLLWPDKTELDVPLWTPRKDGECKAYRKAFEKLETELDNEYRRLLYVALTRAEDRLYIAGTLPSRGMLDDSWYNYIRAAFERLPDVSENPDTGILSIYNPQTKTAKEKADNIKKQPVTAPLPVWFDKPMPEESDPPKPLAPSRPSMPDPAALSPLAASENYRYKRGNIIHTLLQMVPDVEQDRREQAIRQYLKSPAHGLPADEQDNICEETLAILNDPAFAPIFGPGSMAEVPVTGLLDDKTLISGQIDRLLVTDDEILIVDYKTNRPPPDDESGVPVQYRNQLSAYARALEKIYPDRPIRSALLWTNAPRLMVVTL